jgi:hypothetical protein
MRWTREDDLPYFKNFDEARVAFVPRGEVVVVVPPFFPGCTDLADTGTGLMERAEVPAFRTMIFSLAGFIVALTRFFPSDGAAIAPWAIRSIEMNSRGPARSQDILLTLRIANAHKELLFCRNQATVTAGPSFA